jgi:L-ornithine N5-oxygenase
MNIKEKYFDFIGIGFGPSNLALAIALKEDNTFKNYLFLEKKLAFSWHQDTLFSHAKMQTPFLKDLVTGHNPQSYFSFLNYLHQKNRLSEFINLREFFPSRIEFNDYYQWAAQQIGSHVQYGANVLSIAPECVRDEVRGLVVNVQDTQSQVVYELRTNNLILGVGLKPYLPSKCNISSDGVFHSEHLLSNLQKYYPANEEAYSFIVVGGGQSAAEIVYYLLTNYKNARITSLSRSFLYRSIDDNPLVNMLYTNEFSKAFYSLSYTAKNKLLASMGGSNYSAVDTDLIRKISQFVYEEKIRGISRLENHSFIELTSINKLSSSIEVIGKNHLTGENEKYTGEAVCLATGYDASHLKTFLNEIDSHLVYGTDGDYSLSCDYKVITPGYFKASIYIHGISEKDHGFTEGTVANLAGRAQTILHSLKKSIANKKYSIRQQRNSHENTCYW